MKKYTHATVPAIPDPDRTTTRCRRYEAYTQLPGWQQSLVQLVATAPSSNVLTFNVISFASKAKISPEAGRLATASEIEEALSELYTKGILKRTTDFAQVHPHIATACLCDAIALGKVAALRTAIGLSRDPFANEYLYHFHEQYFDSSLLCDAFAIGSWKKFNELYKLSLSKSSLAIHRQSAATKLFSYPFSPQFLISLETVVRDDILRQIMHNAWRHLEPTTEQHAFLSLQIKQKNDPDGWCRYLLGMDDILHGRAVSIAPRDTPAILQAVEYSLAAEDEKAIELFSSAVKALRSQTGCRATWLHDYAGLFCLISHIRCGAGLKPGALDSQIKAALRENYGYDWSIHHLIFQDLAAWRALPADANSQSSRPPRFSDHDIEAFPPDVFLTIALFEHWRQAGNGEYHLALLDQVRALAQAKGYLWLAQEAAATMARMNGNQKTDQTPVPGAPQHKHWIDAVPVTAHWERILVALRGKVTTSATVAEGTKRLVWKIEHRKHDRFHNPALTSNQPRYIVTVYEQKQSTKGGWSPGREIRKNSGMCDVKAMAHLSTQESTALNRFLTYSSYGWHNDTDTTLFSLLVGLPHVYWADDPTPLEIVRREPRLVVQRTKNEICLSLEPFPAENGYDDSLPGALTLEAQHRLGVVQFTHEQIDIARTLGPKGLRAPLEAQTSVMQTLSALSRIVRSHADADSEGLETGATAIDGSPRLHLQLSPAGDGLQIEICVRPVPEGHLHPAGRGGRTVFEFVGEERFQAMRDLKKERAEISALLTACPSLSEFCNNELSFTIADTEIALTALSEVKSMGDAVTLLWPKGEWFDVTRMVDLGQMQLRINRDRDWFALQGELRLEDGQVLHLTQLLNLLESTNSRFIRIDDKRYLALTRELRCRLDQLRSATIVHDGTMRMHPLMALAMPEFEEDAENITGDVHWRKHVNAIKQGMVVTTPIPPGFMGELREYQEEGFAWMCRLAAIKAGACLADDMGLGKTVQAMALLLRRASGGPALVIAPTSVCMNWHIEARRFAPTLNVVGFALSDRAKAIEDAGPNTLVVCTYGLLQTESALLCEKQWHTLILDEAQAIKNITAQRSRAAMDLKADFRLATTGTPIENNLSELWNLFRFLNPGILGSIEEFNRRFALPIEQRKDKEARQRLRRIITPFILRRIKTQVLAELPPKTEIVKWIELTPREAAFHEALRQKALKTIASGDKPNHILVLTQITRLRRACCSPTLIAPEIDLPPTKLAALGESLDELLANNHRALVFSQFVDHLGIIRNYLDKRGVSYQYLDGSTPARDREKRVAAFQAGEGALFLISLKAGGLGLNLTGADFVIHMDPWWNPAVEDQATDRAHRMGQSRPVTVYRFICKGTIEEKIVALHNEKRDLAGGLLDGADISGRMSVDELVKLIREE